MGFACLNGFFSTNFNSISVISKHFMGKLSTLLILLILPPMIQRPKFFFPRCFPLLVIGFPFNYRDFLIFDKICSMLSAAELLYEGKG